MKFYDDLGFSADPVQDVCGFIWIVQYFDHFAAKFVNVM